MYTDMQYEMAETIVVDMLKGQLAILEEYNKPFKSCKKNRKLIKALKRVIKYNSVIGEIHVEEG